MKNRKAKILLAVLLTAVMVTACSQKKENDEIKDAAVENEQDSEEGKQETTMQDGNATEDGSSSAGTDHDSGSVTNSSIGENTSNTRETESGSGNSSGNTVDAGTSGSQSGSAANSSVSANENSDSSAQNTADDEQNSDLSSETDSSDSTERVKAKVKMYEGVYFDEILYTFVNDDVEFSPYCQFYISNVTDTSFDFEIYEVGAQWKETLIFKKHTAIFTGDGMQAVYNGDEYTLYFSFPDKRNAYPDAVDMSVSGFAPVEGRTYVNNLVPGHEFG